MHMIDIIAEQGLDFIPNHYNCIITSPFLEPYTSQLEMRLLNVTIPERKIAKYEIKKRGRTFTRPNGTIDQDKNIDFTFRADKYMNCYKQINSWMQYIQNNETAFIGSDSGTNGMGGASTFRGAISIYTLDSLNSYKSSYTMWNGVGAYPTSLSTIELSEDGGEDALTVDCTFECFNIIYPQN